MEQSLEKLTGFQPVKKFPTFYGTRRFITAFTSARHLFLSCASSIQSIPPTSQFLKIYLNILLPSRPGSPNWSLSFRFPHQKPVHASLPPTRATWPAHLILLNVITRTTLSEDYRSLSSLSPRHGASSGCIWRNSFQYNSKTIIIFINYNWVVTR